jgi:DNA-3-methyladenine glycosylase
MMHEAEIQPPPTPQPERLAPDFFNRPSELVARDLIGVGLLFNKAGGMIVETEAYHSGDPASHSFNGPTLRNAAMFGPSGHAYIYRSYGMHWCLNFVCLPGSGVLIRAIEPQEGRDEMAERRGGVAMRLLTSGPGRLCEALGITKEHYGLSLFAPPFDLLANTEPRQVVVGPRIGISKGIEAPLRFGLESSRYLSKAF